MFELNQSLAEMNQQVNNLQRQLIREKASLQQTLARLHAANEKLAELNATKDRFFSIIGHDLRNPFNAIVGYSSLLAEQVREQDYDGIGEYAEVIEQSAQRALALLHNLLEWSRSQTGRLAYAPADIPVRKLLDDGVALAQDAASQKHIALRCDAPADGVLHGDEAMLATVLRNLLSNAVKFTRSGGHVTVSAREDEHGWTVSVRDDGVGISPEDQARLFRLDESHSTTGTNQEQGTGLGLILCKEFVEKHGGRLWVESAPGQGSTFSFSIPRRVR
ncbi:MAG: HAMP domain-containing sensor histidine kinase [Lentisphaeria bacterium]|nr:HAMP domain-containing sensor histidine kinase [Lentisphaeria bacterium]